MRTPQVQPPGRLGSSSADDLARIAARPLIDLRHDGEALPLHSHKILATLAGANRSAFRGRGMEFEETRPYQPGDDVRSLHWRVTARTGRPHTKLYREERERSVLTLVDLRAPMWFATRGAFKSVIAARAAALLAWSAAHHSDRVGGLIFSEKGHQELRPRLGHKSVLSLIHHLAAHPQPEPMNSDGGLRADAAASAMARLRRVARPGSLIFLIGDFHDLDQRVDAHLAQLSRHCDLVMLFVYDPLERELPSAGRYWFSNGRERLEVHAGSVHVQRSHRQRFEARVERLREMAKRHRMHLLPCATSDSLARHLRSGLGLGAL